MWIRCFTFLRPLFSEKRGSFGPSPQAPEGWVLVDLLLPDVKGIPDKLWGL